MNQLCACVTGAAIAAVVQAVSGGELLAQTPCGQLDVELQPWTDFRGSGHSAAMRITSASASPRICSSGLRPGTR